VELAGGHTAALSFAAFNHDGSRVVTSSADRTIRVWDARAGHELAVLHWHGDAVNEARFDGDGQRILSASDDGTVKLGRCDACNQTLEQLRERVRDEAILTRDELETIKRENRVTMPYFKLPAFLSW
jgi:WD40 repeat protein